MLAAVLILSACTHTDKKLIKTAGILKQDQAQVAITLNKGFENSVIATNNGKRITPCLDREYMGISHSNMQAIEAANLQPCEPLPADGKILYEQNYKVVVREGSVCFSLWVGSRRYDFCDPPYDLGF
jgi:hypothetical protein